MTGKWMTVSFAAVLLCAAIALPFGCGKDPATSGTLSESAQATASSDSQDREGAATVTDANFDEFTGKGVVLLDFWAERCPPCRLQGPIVEEIARKFAGRAKVGKLDVDANNKMPRKFRIQYIPTIIFFVDGSEVKRFTGLQEETALASALEEALRGE
jgi:thioredoxin 1